MDYQCIQPEFLLQFGKCQAVLQALRITNLTQSLTFGKSKGKKVGYNLRKKICLCLHMQMKRGEEGKVRPERSM